MTDCCIIGGGIVGLSIARELAGRGLSVRLLSRDAARDTASWAAAGIFPPIPEAGIRGPCDALTAWSDRLHDAWAAELRAETGIDNGLRRCGGLHTAGTRAALEALAKDAADWRARGAACEPLDGPCLAACEPALAGAVARGGLLGGYLLPDERQIRPPRHLRALERSCVARGVTIDAPVDVTDLLVRDGRVEGVAARVDGRQEIVRAGTSVIAAGAWSERFADALGVAVATRPIRGQIVLLRLRRQVLGRVVNRGLDYLVPRDDGGLLAGSTLEDAGFDPSTTPAAIARLEHVATELLGELPGAVVERSWAGLRPGSADGLPTIGRVPACPDVIVAAGHFRAGLHQSTGTAVLVADLVEGRSSAIDPAPFAPGRPPARDGGETVENVLARAAAPA